MRSKMELGELLRDYLQGQHMMQLATTVSDEPWCCTVYYVHDEQNNLYWASLPERKHSQDIQQNPQVAVAIPIRHIKGEAVVGIQIQGRAEQLDSGERLRDISTAYAEKFGRDKAWIEDFVAGKTDHRLYRLKPEAIYLFDEVNFPGGQRQQVL